VAGPWSLLLSTGSHAGDRHEILRNDTPADVAIESAFALVARAQHAETMLERADASLDATAPAQCASKPAVLLQLRAGFGEWSAGRQHGPLDSSLACHALVFR